MAEDREKIGLLEYDMSGIDKRLRDLYDLVHLILQTLTSKNNDSREEGKKDKGSSSMDHEGENGMKADDHDSGRGKIPKTRETLKIGENPKSRELASNEGGCKLGSMKMEFPRFDGEGNPTGWLNQASHFFDFHKTPEQDKVSWAAWNLQGDAQVWFQLLKSHLHNRIILWEDLEKEFIQCCGPSEFLSGYGELTKLQQNQ